MESLQKLQSQQLKFLRQHKQHSSFRDYCPISDPVQPHRLLRLRDGYQLSVCFGCKGEEHLEGKRYYYFCFLCNLEFHRGCHALPPQMNHPLHLSHPLTLISLDPSFDTSNIPQEWRDSSSDSEVDDDDDDFDDDASPSSDKHFGKCKCCQKRFEDLYYHCSVCNFSLNFTCTIKTPPLSISNVKSHQHTLTLFPRRVPLPCDVCGLSLNEASDPVYACLPCNYMVHRTCIALPRVIKITRHLHRLSLISSLLFGDFSCGVCRQTIDVSYGHYSCIKGCCYGAHSKCATRKDVWDGKDLEEVPEEPQEDIEPFIRIDEETIQHFTHECNLKLQGKGSLQGKEKFCKACCIVISVFDVFYSCVDCDFILHEACACLPRIKHHPLHKHPLILYKSNPTPHFLTSSFWLEGMFDCYGCRRESSGFLYRCAIDYCYKLDVRCASLLDTSFHKSHPNDNHPLYINLTKGECMACNSSCSGEYLECMSCKSFLGVKCATLPSVAYYKHDSHPLSLCYGEKDTTSGQYWCEICESKLDAGTWFYTCDFCRVTLHVTCLLGIDMYMKPQNFLSIEGGGEVEIVLNDGNTRPLCYQCHGRCTDTSVFKYRNKYFCNLHCTVATP